MQLIDRYLVSTYVKVFFVCFISLLGIYCVYDFVENLPEFLEQSGSGEGLVRQLVTHYGARLPLFFDQTSHVIALIASVFVITGLYRYQEIYALMAAGISQARIVRPLLVVTLAVSLLAAANREFGLPAIREQLMSDPRDLAGRGRKLVPGYDHETGVYIGGQWVYLDSRRIAKPNFRLPVPLPNIGSNKLVAEEGQYQAANEQHAGGYLLRGVVNPTRLADLPSCDVQGVRLVTMPRDASWLQPDQCFVASNLSVEYLTKDLQASQFASMRELLGGMGNASFRAGLGSRVQLHARLLQPVLDMLLFFLGVPTVLGQGARNAFVAVGVSTLIVLIYFLVILACHGLGAHAVLSPALAAWAPLLLFVPWAGWCAQPLLR